MGKVSISLLIDHHSRILPAICCTVHRLERILIFSKSLCCTNCAFVSILSHKPKDIDPVCCVVDVALCRGQSRGKAEWVLGVVGAKGGVVVAEPVVRPPGFSIFILACKQQRAGAPTGPCAFAVQRLGGVSLDDIGGGVDGVFG